MNKAFAEETRDGRAKCKLLRGTEFVEYEECTAEEWDRTSETTREFINFKDGRGYIFARPSISEGKSK